MTGFVRGNLIPVCYHALHFRPKAMKYSHNAQQNAHWATLQAMNSPSEDLFLNTSLSSVGSLNMHSCSLRISQPCVAFFL